MKKFWNKSNQHSTTMVKIKDFSEDKGYKKNVSVIIAVALGLLLWYVVTLFKKPALILSTPIAVWNIFIERIRLGYYFPDVWASVRRALIGYSLGMLCAIPVGFLMGWYKYFRRFCEPWIQFFRTIPPIATIPIMVVAFGTGESSKIAIIFIAVFLTSSINIYQGVKEVDKILIKAAYSFGAKDKDIFLHVVLGASFPYILIAARTALSGSFTTLIAAEMTGAFIGLGARIQIASGIARMDIVMMGIISIGIIGFLFDRLLLVFEKRLTRWK